MKSGALDAILGEVRVCDMDFFSPSAVEHWIKKAFEAGKQVAFSAALHECNEEANRYAISTQQYGAVLQAAEAVEARRKKETAE